MSEVMETMRLFILLLFILSPSLAFAVNNAINGSGLPIPRFVSLRTDKVNLRVGPSTDYPIEWVYQRRGVPLEVVAEYDTWRKVRDWEGSEGWVHQQVLSSRRTALIREEPKTLRRQPDEKSGVIAEIEPGAIARLLECRLDWCRLEAGDYRGWMKRADFWGVYNDEKLD
ncbi:MAG: SH3 domain-containing protein [Dongiaceae bacterium]